MSSLRVACSGLFIALLTIFGSVVAIVLGPFDRTGDRILGLARLWSRLILAFGGVKVEVRWSTPLDAKRPYVFMSNHLSAVDIWALLVALPMPVRMIAKKQLGNIPLFGWAMRAGRFIFIDRENPVTARRSIEAAKRRISGGECVLLFPEGTRSPDGRLQAFKKGGFHLAIDAAVPIVPIALDGPLQVMPRGSLVLRPGRVVVTIGAPIPTEGLTDGHRNELLTRVRAEIGAMLPKAATAAETPRPAEPPAGLDRGSLHGRVAP